MKRPNDISSFPATGIKRAAPAHSLTIGLDAAQRHTLSVAERKALADTVRLRAVAQPIAAITQPLSPVRPDGVNATLLANAVFTPPPAGGRRS